MFSPSSLEQQLAASWTAARAARPRPVHRRRRTAARASLTRLVRSPR